MVLFEITSQMPDGSVIIKFANGYIFEGFVDAKNYPISGIIKTPSGLKYYIPEFEEDFFSVFNLIEKSELERFRTRE